MMCLGCVMACAPSGTPSGLPPVQRLITQDPEIDLGAQVRQAEWGFVRSDPELKVAWEFEGGEAVTDWLPVHSVPDLRVVEGSLQGTGIAIDRGVVTDIDLPAGNLDYLWIQVSTEHGGNGRLYWGTAANGALDQDRSLPFALAGGGVSEDLLLPVGGHPGWRGRATRLRLDLPTDCGSFSVAFIRLLATSPDAGEGVGSVNDRAGKVAINDDLRIAIFASPPHETTWSLRVASQGHLEFSYGILQEAWERPGNAVVFRVLSAGEDGDLDEIFSETLRPRSSEADRGWRRASVPVEGNRAGDLNLVFRTEAAEDDEPGIAGSPFGFAVWGDPRIVYSHTPVRPNVILVAIDALRADRTGLLGYSKETTPRLNHLAAESFVFESAWAQASWSLPSYSSLFTSMYPSMTGIVEGSQIVPHDALTLARLLREQGYSTAAFTGGGYAGRHWGMDRGFERFWEGPRVEDLTDNFERWLEETPEEPFLLFLHTYELHDYFRNVASHIERAEALAGRPLELPSSIYQSSTLR